MHGGLGEQLHRLQARLRNSRYYDGEDLEQLAQGRISAALLRAHGGLLRDVLGRDEDGEGMYRWVFLGTGADLEADLNDLVRGALAAGPRVLEFIVGSEQDGWSLVFVFRTRQKDEALVGYVVGRHENNQPLVQQVCAVAGCAPYISAVGLEDAASVSLLAFRERVVCWHRDQPPSVERFDHMLAEPVAENTTQRVRAFLVSAGHCFEPGVPPQQPTTKRRKGGRKNNTKPKLADRLELTRVKLLEMRASINGAHTVAWSKGSTPSMAQLIGALNQPESGSFDQCVQCWRLQQRANQEAATTEKQPPNEKGKGKRASGLASWNGRR